MRRLKIPKRLTSAVVAGAMLLSGFASAAPAAQPSGAAYEPVVLESAPAKRMDYYAEQTPAAMGSIRWVTDAAGFRSLPRAALGEDVTCAVKDADGVYWIGTKNGAMRVDLSEKDERDIVQYFSGSRYLYGGDDSVTAIAPDGNGGVWLQNALGSVHVRMDPMTLLDRTYFLEKITNDVSDRNGFVSEGAWFTYNPAEDEYYGTNGTTDNDGLWTAMYALGEIFRYKTLKAEGAAEAEIAAAKKAAVRATKSVLLLEYVSGRGNGFPCRSYITTGEPAAALSGQYNNFQSQNGFWFEMHMLEEGETYPEPIIPEMQREDMDPIGIATVRFTKDAMEKRGSKLFANDDVTDGMTWNGLSLSRAAIDAFNAAQPEGQKLGTDIVSENGQVYPVMIEGVNTGGKRGSTTNVDPSKVVFRLTVPVYEQIPQIFNELFPAEMIENDQINMEKIIYKADTSSDSVIGQYALFLNAYRYLCDDETDEALMELRGCVAETIFRMTDLILQDDNYYIIDATGKSTQWSRWFAKYFNDGLGAMDEGLWINHQVGAIEGEDALSYGYEDASLNALEVMGALKTTAYIARAEGETEKAQIYETAYDQCYDASYSVAEPYVNGKGYIHMALEHIERRLVRQATNAYGELGNTPLETVEQAQAALAVANESDRGELAKLFNAVLHNDWTQYVNYSDEELCWFPTYCLMTLEENPERRAQIARAYDQWYEGQEEREENPFYTYLYQIAHPEKADVDLVSAARFLYRSPLLRNDTQSVRGDRQDVFYIEPGDRDKALSQWNHALAPDETVVTKNNTNPFTRYTAMGASANANHLQGSLGGATVFTLPYWMGRFYGMLEETDSHTYDKAAPIVTIAKGDAANEVYATVKTSGGAPLYRVIVDFFANGQYIGRGRTDKNGRTGAVTVKTAHMADEIVAQTTERLIGGTVYLQAESGPTVLGKGIEAIHLALPAYCEVVAGHSRMIDFTVAPESANLRGVVWSTDDPEIATVDAYGRFTAIAPGEVTVTATSKYNAEVSASRVINVVETASARADDWAIVNFEGAAAGESGVKQRIIERWTKAMALADDDVPEELKKALSSPDVYAVAGDTVTIGGSAIGANTYYIDSDTWNVASVTDAAGAVWSNESYGVKRVDENEAAARDTVQYFMGDRHLPRGSVRLIGTDGEGGLWAMSGEQNGTAVTHIRLVDLSYTDKAALMSRETQEHVSRRGMVAEANRSGEYADDWKPAETDNDGLWTGMYGAGELMRYATLKREGVTGEKLEAAREAALQSIKAVLLLSNISLRTGTVDAYIRPLMNDSNQYYYDTRGEGIALRKGADLNLNTPQSGPTGAAGPVEGDDYLMPFFMDDWAAVTKDSDKSQFETRKRTLTGFIARTYRLTDEFPGANFNDGYYYKIDTGTKTATVQPTTTSKVKWEDLVGISVDASGTLPDVLAELLGGASLDDVIYKADTSTDEIIGHLFIYKIAYDILDDNDPEEKAVKDVLVDTVRTFAQHMLDNGYCLRDATGQATTWGKTERDYFNNLYAWEDCALNSTVLLSTFKLASYVTGERMWEDEYRMLALEEPYRYADLAGEYWSRWEALAKRDGVDANDQAALDEWIRQECNYSDEEMGMLAYYLLFQMEKDGELLEKYRVGLDAWWNSIQYSENPLWYYIYQLAYPDTAQTDAYGNSLIETASWALSRHPVDTVRWSACAGADTHPEIREDGSVSRDRATGEMRVAPFDEREMHKYNGSTYRLDGGSGTRMEGSTTYTLPYWMGRYHDMLEP